MATKTASRDGPSAEFWLGLFSPVLVAGLFVLIAPIAILRAWVLTMLWGWYAVPAFGVEPLRIVYAFGLSLLVSYLTHQHTDDSRTFMAKIGAGVWMAGMVLLIAWIGTFFI